MPRWCAPLLLIGVLLAACEDEPPPLDAGVAVDLAVLRDFLPPPDVGLDADPPVDAAEPAPARGTRCGDALCFIDAMQYCHTSDWGASGVCTMRPAPAPGFYGCDGPEDCASGACCFLDSASVCGLFGFCVAGTTVGEFMCHGDAECGAQSRCCKQGVTGSYRTCVDGLGPADPCPISN